jgi:hypothetical protein
MAFMVKDGFRLYYEDTAATRPRSCSCTARAATT